MHACLIIERAFASVTPAAMARISLCETQALLCLQAIEELVKKYKTVGGLLRKIEEVVSGTNNGKAPQLAGYYAYWERSIFTALNTMVLTAMRTLVTMLHASSAKKAAAAGLQARPPLFKVHNFCSAPAY